MLDIEKSFRNLVSIRTNYRSKTEKELRQILKDMFESNNDQSNVTFFEKLSYEDLIDLYMCFERYTAMFTNVCFKDIGFAKYSSKNKKYFLFTTTSTIESNNTGEIVGVIDEPTELFQIRNIDDRNNRNIKCYFDYSVITRLGRTNEDQEYAQIAEQMLQSMNTGKNIQTEDQTIIICKSKLRNLFDEYDRIRALLDRSYESLIMTKQTDEIKEFILKLLRHKNELQDKLHQMVVELNEEHGKNTEYDAVSYIDGLEKEATRLFGGQSRGERKNTSPAEECTEEQNAEAQKNREQIKIYNIRER